MFEYLIICFYMWKSRHIHQTTCIDIKTSWNLNLPVLKKLSNLKWNVHKDISNKLNIFLRLHKMVLFPQTFLLRVPLFRFCFLLISGEGGGSGQWYFIKFNALLMLISRTDPFLKITLIFKCYWVPKFEAFSLLLFNTGQINAFLETRGLDEGRRE